MAEAEAELRQAAFTVRSKDRVVEVTVGHQSELTALRFLDDKYRTMAAGQLAASILEATERARTQMAQHVMETFQPFTQPSTDVPELTGMELDWARIFGPSVLETPQKEVDRRGSNRLRDEINEDMEDDPDV